MKLTQRTVAIVIVAAFLALVGLSAIQWILLSHARRLKEQAFRDNALSAMQTVVRQLEVREATEKTRQLATTHPAGAVKVMAITVNDSSAPLISDSSSSLPSLPAQRPFRLDRDTLRYTVPRRERVVIEMRDSASGRVMTLVDTVVPAGSYALPVKNAAASGRQLSVRMGDRDAAAFAVRINCSDSTGGLPTPPDSSRMFIVSQVVDKLIMGEATPIARRLDSAVVDSLLSASFSAVGITLAFASGIHSPTTDSLYFASTTDGPSLRVTDLRTNLFPSDLFASPAELLVEFPNRASFVTRQLMPTAVATIAFMIVIALCFAYSIVTIMRHRRFAQLTVDFINNMTHEFKTPLSTIGLACDALGRPDIAARSEQVQKYQLMIRDENARMRSNVDKILQMAVLEEGDYELTMSETDIHTVVHIASRGAIMLAQQRGGSVDFNLAASPSTVTADVMHLTNIISNVIDNAVKYSADVPRIAISTRIDGRNILLTIADSGIGIPERDIPHLFDKYYRVRTGNVHNVKGFGIGLSYVRLMTEAMGGSVTIASQPGKGTTATLSFPLAG